MSLSIAWRWSGQVFWIIAASVACGVLLAVAMIDWDTFLIPDELSLGLVVLGLAAAPINPYFSGASWPVSFWWSFRGGLVGLAMAWAIAAGGEALLKKEALGGGDVKLLAAVGAWTGATGAFDCLMIGSFFGSIYGLKLILSGQATRSDPIPFGPFLSAAAVFNFFRLLPFGWPLV
jgi:leader peptidase (prepilin peptidase)/N-methyltransferase